MKYSFLFLFLFTCCSSSIIAANNIELNDLKQKDDLYSWCFHLFDEVLTQENEANYSHAELICDSIINNIWREANSLEEFDLLTEIYAYKGFYCQDKEHIVEANNAFETSLKHYALSSKINEHYLAFIYPKLGNNYTRLGDNDKAILIHQKMISYAEKHKNYDALVQAYINLSISIENKGNTSKAKQTLTQALPFINQVSPYRKAIVYSNLGAYSYSEKLNFTEAKKYLFKAEQLLKNTDSDSYFLAGIYRGLGEIYKDEMQKEKAISYFNNSLENYKKSNNNRSREIAKTYVLISELSDGEKVLHNLDSAYFNLTKTHLEQANVSQIYAENTFIEVFKAYIKQDISNDKKLHFYKLILKAEKELRNEYLYDSSKYDILKENRIHLEDIMSLCFENYSISKQDTYVSMAFEFLEASKSVILFENLKSSLNNENKNDFSIFNEKRKELKTELLKAQLVEEENKAKQIQSEIDQLKFDFSIKNKNFERIINDENKKFESDSFVQTFLNKNEIIVSYFTGENYVYIVMISSQEKAIYRIKNDQYFKKELQIFKSNFTFKNRFRFDRKTANSLAKKLLPFSIVSYSKMVLIGDKGIDNIPFEALILDQKYLIEQIECYYAFSAQILAHKTINKEANAKLIAFAPIFKNDNLKWLKKSKEEIEQINKYIDSDNYFEAEANSEKFLELAPSYDLIHVSTHAQINQKLQVASIDFYDKSLYFNQIVDEKFNSKLLVLSACETGIGENKVGEGSMSLSRAFAYANIATSISSLWKVNEESSVYLLSNFYKNLNNYSFSKALRQSKLEYLKDENISDEKKTPYYWASYILVGKDNKIELNNKKTNTSLVLIFGVILMLAVLLSLWQIKMKRSR